MMKIKFHKKQFYSEGIFAAFFISLTLQSLADVVLDGSLSNATIEAVDGAFVIEQSMGGVEGSNLFHSFSEFNLAKDQSAVFEADLDIERIIGRVSGNSMSTIDGSIQVDTPNVDLFLLNPNGWLFGENAEIDVQGSFYLSTADYLAFDNNGRFYSKTSGNSILSTAPPDAFGFLSASQGGIEFKTQKIKMGSNAHNMSFVGGDINITGRDENFLDEAREIIFSNNDINLIATQSSGEVSIEGMNLDQFELLADVTLENVELIVKGERDSAIFVGGENIFLDNALLSAFNTGDLDHTQSIIISARDAISIIVDDNTRSDNEMGTFSAPNATGKVGDVIVEAKKLSMRGNTSTPFGSNTLVTRAKNSSMGGDIIIDVRELNIFDNSFIKTETQGQGDSGNIFVSADYMNLFSTSDNRSGIESVSDIKGSGDTGDIHINANSIIMGSSIEYGPFIRTRVRQQLGDMEDIEALDGIDAGNTTSAFLRNVKNTGDILISTDTLTVINQGQIVSTNEADGDTGKIRIKSRVIRISGNGVNSELPVGIFSTKSDYNEGTAGEIEIRSDTLSLANGAEIKSASSSGDSGDITLTANDISLDSNSRIASGTVFSGKAGDLNIQAKTISLTNNAIVTSQSGFGQDSGVPEEVREIFNMRASGRAGNIKLTGNQINIEGGAQVKASSFGSGDSGEIELNSRELYLNNNSLVTASTAGSGLGGKLLIKSDLVSLDSRARLESSSGSDGNGGSLLIIADKLSVENQSSLESSSTGAGLAGDIELQARRIDVLNNSSLKTSSEKSTGGNIQISENTILNIENSLLLTDVTEGKGNGGNIVSTSNFIILDDSEIIADAEAGVGGNINLNTAYYFPSPSSILSAEAGIAGVNGNIVTTTPSNTIVKQSDRLSASEPLTETISDACRGLVKGESTFTTLRKNGSPPGLRPLEIHLNRSEQSSNSTNSNDQTSIHLRSIIRDESPAYAYFGPCKKLNTYLKK